MRRRPVRTGWLAFAAGLATATVAGLVPAACAPAVAPVPVHGPAGQPAYLLEFQPAAYPELGGRAPAAVSVAGDFNGGLPVWPLARRADGSWAAACRLADGPHTYRYRVERADGSIADLHDRAWSFLVDDGWGDKERTIAKRTCLYIRKSGFVARGGQRLPLPGGLREFPGEAPRETRGGT